MQIMPFWHVHIYRGVRRLHLGVSNVRVVLSTAMPCGLLRPARSNDLERHLHSVRIWLVSESHWAVLLHSFYYMPGWNLLPCWRHLCRSYAVHPLPLGNVHHDFRPDELLRHAVHQQVRRPARIDVGSCRNLHVLRTWDVGHWEPARHDLPRHAVPSWHIWPSWWLLLGGRDMVSLAAVVFQVLCRSRIDWPTCRGSRSEVVSVVDWPRSMHHLLALLRLYRLELANYFYAALRCCMTADYVVHRLPVFILPCSTPCPSGQFGSITGSTSCNGTACPLGQYGPTGATSSAAATCSPCPVGTYASATGSGKCTPVSNGRYINTTGATSNSAGIACAAGYYAPVGATACLLCPPGFSCGASTQNPSVCPSQYYSTGGASSCTVCTNSYHMNPTGAASGAPACAVGPTGSGYAVIGAAVRNPATGISYFATDGGTGSRINSVREGLQAGFQRLATTQLATVDAVKCGVAFPGLNMSAWGMSAATASVALVSIAGPIPVKVSTSLVPLAGEYPLVTAIGDTVNDIFYGGTGTLSVNPKIVQVAVSPLSLSRTDAVTMWTITQPFVASAIDEVGGFGYFVAAQSAFPTTIVRFPLGQAASLGISNVQILTLTLPFTDGVATAASADSSYLYVACTLGSTYNLVRVSLADFSRDSSIVMLDGSGIADGPVRQVVALGPLGLVPTALTSPIPFTVVLGHGMPSSGNSVRMSMVFSNATVFQRVNHLIYSDGLGGVSAFTVALSNVTGNITAYFSTPGSSPTEYIAMSLHAAPVGYYNDVYGYFSPCPSGKYGSAANLCTPAPIGMYAPTSGLTVAGLQTCANGTYRSSPGGSSCAVCSGPSGTGMVVNQLSLTTWSTSCSAGYVSAVSSTVATCNADGSYSGAITCRLCAGGYSAAGASSCTPCPAGTYQGSVGYSAGFCYGCGQGTFSGAGAASCSKCPAGSYQSSGYSVSCSQCSSGYSTSSPGSTDSTQCTPCEPGSATTAGGTCSLCQRGYISTTTASSACSKCPAGSTTAAAGATGCIVPDSASLALPAINTTNTTFTALAFSVPTAITYTGASNGFVYANGVFGAVPAKAFISGLGYPSGLAMYGSDGAVLLVADNSSGSVFAVGVASGYTVIVAAGMAKGNQSIGQFGLAAIAADPTSSTYGTIYALESSATASGSRILAINGGVAAASVAAAGLGAVAPASAAVITVLGVTTPASVIREAPASLALDPGAVGGPLLLVGNAHGQIIAVPTNSSGLNASWLWLDSLYDEPVTELVVDASAKQLMIVLGNSGNIFFYNLDNRTFASAIAAPAAYLPLAGTAIDTTSGQVMAINPTVGSVNVGFRCNSATAGSGFIQPCSIAACSAGSASTPAGTCEACMAGTYSTSGQTTCTPCAVGTYSGNGSTTCTACAAGTSTHASTILSPTTYYPLSTILSGGATSSSQCISCPAGTASNGGGPCKSCEYASVAVATSATALTNPAATGATYCAACPGGYSTSAANPYSCTICPTGTYRWPTQYTPCLPYSCPTCAAPPGSAASPGGDMGEFYLPTPNPAGALAQDIATGFVYFGSGSGPKVTRGSWGSTKFETNSHSVVVAANTSAGQMATTGAIHAGLHRLIVVMSYPSWTTTAVVATIVSYNIETNPVQVLSTVLLNAGETAASMVLASASLSDPYFYVATTNGSLVKFVAATLGRVAQVSLASALSPALYAGTGVIDSTGTYAYFAAAAVGSTASANKHCKVRLSDMTVITTGTFSSGRYNAVNALLDTTNNRVVYHLDVSPTQVVWVSQSTLAEAGSLTLSDLNGAMPIVLNSATGAVAADGTSLVVASNSAYSDGNSAAIINITNLSQVGASWFGLLGGTNSRVNAYAGEVSAGVVMYSYVDYQSFRHQSAAVHLKSAFVSTMGVSPVRPSSSIGSSWNSISLQSQPANLETASPFKSYTVLPSSGLMRTTQSSLKKVSVTGSTQLDSTVYNDIQSCALDQPNGVLLCVTSPNGNAAAPVFLRISTSTWAVTASTVWNVNVPVSPSYFVLVDPSNPAGPTMYLQSITVGSDSLATSTFLNIRYSSSGFTVMSNSVIAPSLVGQTGFSGSSAQYSTAFPSGFDSSFACGYIASNFAYIGVNSYGSTASILKWQSTSSAFSASGTLQLTAVVTGITDFDNIYAAAYSPQNYGVWLVGATNSGGCYMLITNGIAFSSASKLSVDACGSPNPVLYGTKLVVRLWSSFVLIDTNIITFPYSTPPAPTVTTFSTPSYAYNLPGDDNMLSMMPDYAGNAAVGFFATSNFGNMAVGYPAYWTLWLPFTSCAEGYAPSYGSGLATNCKLCPPGTYAPLGAPWCITSPAGTYAANSGQTSADGCPDGFYSNSGATSCTACPAGTASSATYGSPSCTPCLQGYYSATVPGTSASCQVCPAGTMTALYGSTSCVICPAGTYINNPSQVGIFMVVVGISSCWLQ